MPQPPTPERRSDAQPGEQKAAPRTYARRAERSLREIERVLKANADGSPLERASLQLRQAHVLALLDLAMAIRDHKGGAPEE